MAEEEEGKGDVGCSAMEEERKGDGEEMEKMVVTELCVAWVEVARVIGLGDKEEGVDDL